MPPRSLEDASFQKQCVSTDAKQTYPPETKGPLKQLEGVILMLLTSHKLKGSTSKPRVIVLEYVQPGVCKAQRTLLQLHS